MEAWPPVPALRVVDDPSRVAGWDDLIELAAKELAPPATLDVRVNATAQRLYTTVLAMLRNRAKTVGPVAATDAHRDFERAIGCQIDAAVAMVHVLRETPHEHRVRVLPILQAQLRALLVAANVTRVTDAT